MKNIQKLIYGDRNLFISSVKCSESNINPIEITKFLLTLNELGYKINNMNLLFKLSPSNFNEFKEELFTLFNEVKIEGFIFRKSFADSLELKDYTNEEWKVMFAQYSLTYSWVDDFTEIFDENPEQLIKDYFKANKISEIKTATKEFLVSFDMEKDLQIIATDILNSKTVLREQQISVLNEIPIGIVKKALEDANIRIKEIEIMIAMMLVKSCESIPISLFTDVDQIVRIVAMIFSGDSELKQLTKKELMDLKIKLPTSIKKTITKALNKMEDIDYTVEKMFKYYGFWKNLGR